MKAFYLLSIVAVGVISTIVGTSLVVAGTAEPRSEAVTLQATAQAAAQIAAIDQLTAQAASSATWRRPL